MSNNTVDDTQTLFEEERRYRLGLASEHEQLRITYKPAHLLVTIFSDHVFPVMG